MTGRTRALLGPGPARGALLAAVAALSFGATCAAIGALVPRPWPAGFEVTDKLAWFGARADRFDAVFLGSSRVFRSFVPAVVDARLAELGVPLRSFNLGGPGMEAFEVDHLLRVVLALPRQRLALVFIEPAPLDPSADERNALTERSVNWHSTRQTLAALSAIAAAPAPFRDKAVHAARHVRAWALRTANVGAALALLPRPARAPERRVLPDAVLEQHAGYQPLEAVADDDASVAARRRKLLDDVPGFRRRIADAWRQVRRPGDGTAPGEAHAAAALRRQAAAVRAAGAVPVYVLPPAVGPHPLAAMLAREPDLTDIALDDPVRYADFYRPERRFDVNHLDEGGARALSTAFAEALAAHPGLAALAGN